MDIENLLLLPDTEINNILFHLNKRYNEDKIYTYAGKILIAVNPFQNTNLYSDEIINKFLSEKYSSPHLFELANDAINSDEKNLAFLISGESGSGKTESTKRLLNYFSKFYKDINNVLPKILQLNCLLEALGNASTIRNHNSSRFGKFIKVNINANGEISGKIKTYLLEKIRVVSENLINYHIFYSFGYKNNKPDYLINPREDWDSKYLDKENLKKIWINNGLDERSWLDIENIIYFLIGLLENKINKNFLENYMPFLTMDDINNVFSFKTINTGEETIKTELTIGEVKSVMHTIAMTLYDKLFDRIVFLINEKLGEDGEDKKSFGILDIFGFEVFTNNGFEQLCINYTNEKLQSIFNRYVFEEEIKMFEEEGILKSRITFETNSHILEFFDKKQNGFFPLLDEKSILNANDSDLERSLPKNDRVVKFKIGSFLIKHYADTVEYQWGDFALKNVERLNTDVLEFCNKIYRNLSIFNVYFKKSGRRGSIGNVTITNQFRQSLNSLIDELDKSQLYFIRCIKPNEENRAKNWVEKKIIDQLNYCGIISALELARQSYPIRMLKKDFIVKYEPVYLKENLTADDWIRKMDFGDFLVGKTRIFFSRTKQKELNEMLIAAQKILIERLACFVKSNYYKIRWMTKKESVIILQNNFRGYLCKRILSVKKAKMYMIGTFSRFWVRLEYIHMKRLVYILELAWIKKKNRKRARRIIKLKIIGYILRKQYVKMILSERENLENIIQMRIDLAKHELDCFYRDKVEKLEKRVRELEKFEGLYNDLSCLINQNNESLMQKNSESMMLSTITKKESSENFKLLGAIEESQMDQSLLIKSDMQSGLFDDRGWMNQKLEYVNAIQNLTNRVNYEFERFQQITQYYEEIQYEFQNYKADIKEAQILMSEKMYRMHNENIMLREENGRLINEFNRNYGKSWLQKLFS